MTFNTVAYWEYMSWGLCPVVLFCDVQFALRIPVCVCETKGKSKQWLNPVFLYSLLPPYSGEKKICIKLLARWNTLV